MPSRSDRLAYVRLQQFRLSPYSPMPSVYTPFDHHPSLTYNFSALAFFVPIAYFLTCFRRVIRNFIYIQTWIRHLMRYFLTILDKMAWRCCWPLSKEQTTRICFNLYHSLFNKSSKIFETETGWWQWSSRYGRIDPSSFIRIAFNSNWLRFGNLFRIWSRYCPSNE